VEINTSNPKYYLKFHQKHLIPFLERVDEYKIGFFKFVRGSFIIGNGKKKIGFGMILG
jgi:hypothetical protein